MTNHIALVLGLLIVALFVADATLLHWNLPIQIGRMVLHLIEWVSFWR